MTQGSPILIKYLAAAVKGLHGYGHVYAHEIERLRVSRAEEFASTGVCHPDVERLRGIHCFSRMCKGYPQLNKLLQEVKNNCDTDILKAALRVIDELIEHVTARIVLSRICGASVPITNVALGSSKVLSNDPEVKAHLVKCRRVCRILIWSLSHKANTYRLGALGKAYAESLGSGIELVNGWTDLSAVGVRPGLYER